MNNGVQDLKQIQQKLKNCLNQFESRYVKTVDQDSLMRTNNQNVIPIVIKIFTHSLKPLEYILRFLTQTDIQNFATSCQALYKLVYSPLGFRLIRHLRPVILVKQKQQQFPVFSQITIDQLTRQRSLQNVDEDDKMAIILTIKTNIMATRQKVGELDVYMNEYDRKSEKVLEKLMFIGGEREQQMRKNNELQQEIQKLRQLLKVGQGHVDSLKQQQQKMLMERQTRNIMLTEQKQKLQRQKQLLIKKIKSQQKQKEQGLVYAKEVSRILTRLNTITSHSKK